ncbi:hypothetical protein ACFVZD_47195 [Streptomyces sp. NPDC058287]|uniref:hypothetical protein n=1 Tax=unclassified Streptomyces TaxID=2593676 RepID=UPI0036E287C0
MARSPTVENVDSIGYVLQRAQYRIEELSGARLLALNGDGYRLTQLGQDLQPHT